MTDSQNRNDHRLGMVINHRIRRVSIGRPVAVGPADRRGVPGDGGRQTGLWEGRDRHRRGSGLARRSEGTRTKGREGRSLRYQPKGSERVAGRSEARGAQPARSSRSAKSEDSERVREPCVTSVRSASLRRQQRGHGGAQAPAEGPRQPGRLESRHNIKSQRRALRHAYQIPAMLKAGARESAIVNMASIHGTGGCCRKAPYPRRSMVLWA